MPLIVLFIPVHRNARKKWQEAYRQFRARRKTGLEPLSERELLRQVSAGSRSWPYLLWCRLVRGLNVVSMFFASLSVRWLGGRKKKS